MNSLPRKILGLTAIVALASSMSGAYADPTSADINASNNPNIAGTSTLYRHSNGVGMTATVSGLRGGTDLAHGHPYTVWAVIFNAPGECAEHPAPCGLADLLAGRGQPGVTQASRNYSDSDGTGIFSGFVPEGDVLSDSAAAEVHFVYRRHPDRNPEYDSLNMVGGNCKVRNGETVDGPRRNQCEDEGFSIHQP